MHLHGSNQLIEDDGIVALNYQYQPPEDSEHYQINRIVFLSS